MTREEKKKFAEVEKAFNQFKYVFSSIQWGQYWENYFKISLQEERDHLRGCPADVSPGLTAQQGAKYFCVKWILEMLEEKRNRPTLRDVLHVRPAYIMAGTLLENYGEEIKRAFRGEGIPGGQVIDFALLEGLDYAELAKDDAEKCATV